MTEYTIARPGVDYRRCHELIRSHDASLDHRISWPTVMAYRDGELVGLLATTQSRHGLVAGPLLVSDEIHVKSFVGLRLIETYDTLMRDIGVKAYLFSMKQAAIGMVQRGSGLIPYSLSNGQAWYVRQL